jgi:hypothetical protein
VPKEELIKCYRYFVYKCGNIKRLSLADIEGGKDPANVKSAIDDETYRYELMRDFKLPSGEIMLGRIRKEFCVIIVSYCSHQGKISFKQNLDGTNGNYHHFNNHIQTSELGIISVP